jgi:hypothetical protein
VNRFFTIVVCASICFVPRIYANSNFADFQYKVDSFEVHGNQAGDAVDNFDDGVVSPWHIEEQTVTETGGYLVLSTPGVLFGPYEMGGVSWMSERSSVNSEDAHAFDVAGGAGDFDATSRWASGAAVPERFLRNGALVRDGDI